MKKQIPLKQRCQIRSLVVTLNLQVQEDQSLPVVEKEQIEFLQLYQFLLGKNHWFVRYQ